MYLFFPFFVKIVFQVLELLLPQAKGGTSVSMRIKAVRIVGTASVNMVSMSGQRTERSKWR